MADALRERGLNDPEVQIQLVDRLIRQQTSGKLRRFVPLSAQQNAGGNSAD